MTETMPPNVAKAICAVMADVPKLGKGEKNTHGNYNFASIDDFLEAVRPLCAKHGLIILQDETSFDMREGWLVMGFAFTLAHSSGETWSKALNRSIMVNAKMGAQAFGTGQSYALKQFMRALFQIATGESDADSHEQTQLPAKAPEVWTGPMGKTEIKTAMRELSTALNGGAIGTTGDLEAVTEEYAAIIEQAKRDLPDWYAGYEKTRKQLLTTLMVGPRTANPDNPSSYQDR